MARAVPGIGAGSDEKRAADGRDEETKGLKTKVGELTMDNELLYGAHPRHGGREPFLWEEGEVMGRQASTLSSRKPYGLARVCGVWEVARSSMYAWRERSQRRPSQNRRRPPILRAQAPARAGWWS